MRLGLTGGLASGKSLVSAEFARLGARVIDADVISRETTAPGTETFKAVVKEFGEGVLREDGSIDRAALGEIVFSDPERLRVLNRITHPAIRERIRSELRVMEKEDASALIVVDAALLIETGLYREMDRVAVVYADTERRMERVMERDGIDEHGARVRMGAQMPLEEKLDYADYIIENNGSIEEAVRRAAELFEELRAVLG